MFPFLKYRKVYYFFSLSLVLGSIFSLLIFGLNLGIEFTGGAIIELEYFQKRPSNEEIRAKLKDLNLGQILIQPTGEKNLIIKTKNISERTHQKILEILGKENFKELRFEAIGPLIGKELKEKTKILTILALLAILIYIAFAFKRLLEPKRPWQYGLIAILALCHDTLIPLGLFSFLGHFYNVSFTLPIVVALLMVIGYSVNDTVVIFDRIRENLLKKRRDSFEKVIDFSLNQTLVRSINTSFTTLLVLFAIFFFGGESLKYFALALIVGVGAGTYSSIFLAGPLLYSWPKFEIKKRK